MTITLAFDSFKGSLRSDEVADAFEKGIHSVMPECNIRKTHVADGGEGTMESLTKSLNGVIAEVTVRNPIGNPVCARYGIIDNGLTAVIEMAEASGLTLLRPDECNPMHTSTFGTGQIIAHALRRGCRKVLMGIGGSATNDCGTGMLCALGFRFLDQTGTELEGCGINLEQIASIDSSEVMPEVMETEFIVACDVTNPLYGANGAAHVFAPQKGANETMVEQLDRGLKNFAEVIKRTKGKDIANLKGAGAAGGLGGGMHALLNAQLQRGIDIVLNAICFKETIKGSDYIVTGEGKIDHQTLMGKVPFGVLNAASAQGIPVIAIGGKIEWCESLKNSGYHHITSINDEDTPLETAMRHDVAKENVRRTGEKIGLWISSSLNHF